MIEYVFEVHYGFRPADAHPGMKSTLYGEEVIILDIRERADKTCTFICAKPSIDVPDKELWMTAKYKAYWSNPKLDFLVGLDTKCFVK